MNKFAVVLLLAGLASAQTTPPESTPGMLVYEFKNVDIYRARNISDFVTSLLSGRVEIHVDQTFKTAIIRTRHFTPPQGEPAPSAADLTKAEELLKRYDVPPTPPPGVEFVAYLVRASTRARPQNAPPGQPIPPVLQEAVAEMKANFAYSDYELLDTVVTEVRNHADVENMFPGQESPDFYKIEYGDTAVSLDRKTVSVSPFKFTVRIPTGGAGNTQYENTGITTDVAIHEGQKLVLGKVRTGYNAQADIFLVLTVKLH
jgi:hypothetical protein